MASKGEDKKEAILGVEIAVSVANSVIAAMAAMDVAIEAVACHQELVVEGMLMVAMLPEAVARAPVSLAIEMMAVMKVVME